MLDAATALVNNGYAITPIREKSKAPLIQSWPDNPIIDMQGIKAQWGSGDYGIGVICGMRMDDNTTLVAIDVDTNNKFILASVPIAIGKSAPAKRGAKGMNYFVRVPYPYSTTRRKSGKLMIEVLGAKTQTVVPPSVHPNGNEYEWVGLSLADVPVDELPLVDEWVLDEIFSLLLGESNCKIATLNHMDWQGVGGGGDTHDISVMAVAAMVSRNWPDDAIHARIERAKREAVERAGEKYNWPEAYKTISGWIKSARAKGFTDTTKKRKEKEVAPDEFVKEFILVRDTTQLTAVSTHEAFTQEKFVATYMREFDTPWQAVLRNPTLRSVRGYTYKPQQPGDVVVQEQDPDSGDMGEYFNLYRPPTILPKKGNVDLFLEHVYKMFPEEKIAKHILHWFAHLVQNPGDKVMHALLIQGKQGIGKSFLAYAMSRVLGRHNVGIVDHSETSGTYTGWMRGKQLVAIEEVLGQRRRDFVNHLKALITADRVRINEKYVAIYEIPNRTNLMLLTNYEYALILDPDDRRFFVANSPATVGEFGEKYFNDLWNWIETEKGAAALLQHLGNKKEYKMGGAEFSATKAPPVTQAKLDTIEASRAGVEHYLIDQFHAKGWPMACDLVSVNHVFFAIQSKFRGVYLNQIQQVVSELGGKRLSQRKLVDGERMTLYSMRSHKAYNAMDVEGIERTYNKPIPMRFDDHQGVYDKPIQNKALGAVKKGEEY